MAKYKITWAHEARMDLYSILEFYYKRNGNVTYSSKLNSRIQKRVGLLSKNPFIGVQTGYESVRVLIVDEFQIIYEVFNQLILIIMVWDSRRNPEERTIDKRIK